MKNYRFPRVASRSNIFLGNLKHFRVLLVVALIAAATALPFYVLAQNDTVVTTKGHQYSEFTDGGAYVVYQGPNGETTCRDASVAEARAMRSVDNSSGLHQINHLKDSVSTASSGGTSSPSAGLTIILRATQQLEANQTAKAAFIAAAAKWEAVIKDPITIIIDVDFGTTAFGTPFSSSTVIGVTTTQLLFFTGDYPDVRGRLVNHAIGSAEISLANSLPTGSIPTDIGSVNTVLVASPLLRALGVLQADATTDTTTPGDPPRIGFNSAFNFDFDPNDGITGNRTDFDAVAVHEMGHALGFNSEVGDRELDPSQPLLMTVWDLYRFRPSTATLNNFGTVQRILSSGGSQVYFNGGPELGLSTGRPDNSGGDGNQASHWQDDFIGGVYIGIMDPTIARNTRQLMTANDQAAIDYLGYATTAATPPPNDNFVDAQTISGTSGSVNGTNQFATKEAGEPSHSPDNNPGGRSVWYRWTAPSSGNASLTTAGSNFDTLLAVYTGNAVNALTACPTCKNDDVDPGIITTSTVQFTAVAGTTYSIAVDGFNGDQGSIQLNFTLPGAPTPTPTPTPGPNTVQFNLSTASATETPGATTKVDLLITRTGDIAAAATVDYATSDATATERSDYETTRGTLHFAAGETQKILPVFIVDDAFGEPDETFNVALSNPVFCTLGSTTSVTVTIHSNESVNGSNPVKDGTFNNDFFVRQHYLDFFNRAPDAGGLAFWTNQLDECERTPLPGGFTDAQQCREIRRINVSAAFFLSIEFQQTGYLVERLYKVAYGDTTATSVIGGTHQISVPIVRFNEFFADTQEIGNGVIIGQPGADQLLEANKQLLISEFVQRARFTTAYPSSMTPTNFVNALADHAGPGLISTAERNQLISDLTNNVKNRAQVLRAIAEDPDLFNAEQNRAFVLAQYFGYLRRNPNDSPEPTLDYSGYDFWLGKLNQFNGNFVNAEMVKAFIISGEYLGRFGP